MKVTIGNLELAQFTPEDTQELYGIRNHVSVRSFMTNSAVLPYEQHEAWVKKSLIEGHGFLVFLARLRAEEAIGFTLLRRQSPESAEIGVIFKEATQHPVVPCVSSVATMHLGLWHLNLAWLVSYVAPTHDRALSLNRALGFTEIESDKPDELKMRINRELCLGNPNYLKVFKRMKEKLAITGDSLGKW